MTAYYVIVTCQAGLNTYTLVKKWLFNATRVKISLSEASDIEWSEDDPLCRYRMKFYFNYLTTFLQER